MVLFRSQYSLLVADTWSFYSSVRTRGSRLARVPDMHKSHFEFGGASGREADMSGTLVDSYGVI
jgi:hypothetical protein